MPINCDLNLIMSKYQTRPNQIKLGHEQAEHKLEDRV